MINRFELAKSLKSNRYNFIGISEPVSDSSKLVVKITGLWSIDKSEDRVSSESLTNFFNKLSIGITEIRITQCKRLDVAKDVLLIW